MIENEDIISDDDADDDNRKKAKAGSFQAMGLEKELLWGINRMGYKVPTPVQRKALPIALAGMDMVCMARTGSGKTCVFLLPLMQKIKKHDPSCGVRAVVLSPTRYNSILFYLFTCLYLYLYVCILNMCLCDYTCISIYIYLCI
jgi:ATP-dependent RNA helicase DDX54/DBP10